MFAKGVIDELFGRNLRKSSHNLYRKQTKTWFSVRNVTSFNISRKRIVSERHLFFGHRKHDCDDSLFLRTVPILYGNSNFEKFSIRCKLSAIILVIADNLHKIPTGELSIFFTQSRKFRTYGNLSTMWGRVTKRGVNFPVETAPKHLARRGEGRWERCSVARCALRFSMVTNVQNFSIRFLVLYNIYIIYYIILILFPHFFPHFPSCTIDTLLRCNAQRATLQRCGASCSKRPFPVCSHFSWKRAYEK